MKIALFIEFYLRGNGREYKPQRLSQLCHIDIASLPDLPKVILIIIFSSVIYDLISNLKLTKYKISCSYVITWISACVKPHSINICVMVYGYIKIVLKQQSPIDDNKTAKNHIHMNYFNFIIKCSKKYYALTVVNTINIKMRGMGNLTVSRRLHLPRIGVHPLLVLLI